MMDSSASGEALYCTDCRRTTAVVLDHSTGDTICTECALVLDAHYIDETYEWRNFADNDRADDPCRVGGAGDPFLNARLTTVITYPGGAANKPQQDRMRTHGVDGGAPERALVDAFSAIADMADRLGLVATIKDRAKEVFKKLEEAKACPRVRNRDAVYAACLYIACRNEGKPRTYKELASVTADCTAARKEIGKLTKMIVRRLGEAGGDGAQVMDAVVVRAGDYLRRFCSVLGLGHPEVRAAQEATRRLEASLDVRRNPDSIAAAIIYMVVERAGAGKSVKDVSMATGVAQNTIKEAHKDLTPHAELLFGA